MWHFHGVILDPILSFFFLHSFFFFFFFSSNKVSPASATIVKPFDLDKIMVSLTLLFFPCPLDKIGQNIIGLS